MGFAEVFTLLLIGAKLFGYGHYGWLIAFSPMLVIYGGILIFMGFAAVVALVVAKVKL